MNAHGWAAALVIFLLTSDPVSEGDTKETITVRAVDAASGAALEGVAVHVDPTYPDWKDPPPAQTTVTGKDGRASVQLSQRYLTTWMFRRTGYLVSIHDGDDVKNGTVVRMTPATPLRVRVVRGGDGKAIVGARVHQWLEGWDLEPIDRPLVTDADGAVRVPGLPAGKTVMFGVAAEGCASVVAGCPPDRREAPLVVTLGEGASVSGRVLDAKGRPAALADVYLAERGGDDPLRSATGADGRSAWLVAALRNHVASGADGSFRFVGVPVPGDYIVHGRSKDGAEGRSEPVLLRDAGKPATIELRVRRLAAITLRLFDAETEEEIDAFDFSATMDARRSAVEPHRGTEYDAKTRRKSFVDVRPGTHEIYVDPDHHVKTRVAVTVRPGEHRELRILVEKGTFLKGRLVNPSGAPLSAHVRLYWMDDGEEEFRSGMAAEDGRFELRAVPETEAKFVAWPGVGGEGEWKVTTGRDLGDLVVKPGPRVVGRLVGVEHGGRGEGGVVYASGGGRCGDLGLGKDGRFVLKHVLPGREFAVYVGVAGRAPFVKRGLRIEAGQTIDLGEVRLPEPCTVRGTVVDPSGKPVPNARVRVVQYWCDGRPTTDGAGRFELTQMPPGRSLLVVELRGAPVAYVPVDAAPDAEPVVLKIETPGTIVATVRERDGSPVARLPFNLFPRTPDGLPDWNRRVIVRTDGRGVIRARAISGRWFLEPHPNYRRNLTAPCPPIEVTSGNETSVALTME